MKKIIKRNLPLTTNYTLVDKYYKPIENCCHWCDNCGRPIASIAEVRNEEGKLFNIGFDCLETVLINNQLLNGMDVAEYERSKPIINAIVRQANIIKKGISEGHAAIGLIFEKESYIGGGYVTFYFKYEKAKPYNSNFKVKNIQLSDMEMLIKIFSNILPKFQIEYLEYNEIKSRYFGK